MRGLEVFTLLPPGARSSQRLPFALGIPCVVLSLISASLAPGLLSTAWILGTQSVTTALPHYLLTNPPAPCAASGECRAWVARCGVPKRRRDTCSVMQRKAINILAPSFSSYCLVNYHEKPSCRFFPTALVKPGILQSRDESSALLCMSWMQRLELQYGFSGAKITRCVAKDASARAGYSRAR